MRLLLISPAHLGNILHAHDAAALGAHRFIGQFRHRTIGAAGLHVQPGFAGLHRARRQILAAAAQRIGHGGGRNAQLRHAPGIERHAHFRRGQRVHPRPAHTRHPDQPFAQILGDLFQPAITRGVRHQRKLQHGGFGGARFLELQAVERAGQILADRVHLAHDLVVILLRVTIPAEFARDDRGRIGGARLHLHNAIQALDHILDRLGDGAFHVGRFGPRHIGNHADERRRKMRINRTRNAEKRRRAQRRQRQKHHQRDLPFLDGKADDAVHLGAPVTTTAWPSRSRSAPVTTTCSPADRPDVITTPSLPTGPSATSRLRTRRPPGS